HGWTPGGIVQRTARTPARRQNGPRPGTHLGTSAAPATESEYCSRFPLFNTLCMENDGVPIQPQANFPILSPDNESTKHRPGSGNSCAPWGTVERSFINALTLRTTTTTR